MKSAVTVSLVAEARGGPFVFWDDLPAACQRARELGFDAIELFAPAADAVEPAHLRQLLEENGLSLAAVGTGAGSVKHGLNLALPEENHRRTARDFIRRMIDFGGEFGAPAIIGSMQGRSGGEVEPPTARTYLLDALEELGSHAGQYDVPLLFEPLNRYETNQINTLGEGMALLQELDTGNVKLLGDLFHMNIEETDIAAAVRSAGNRLGHVHFVDSNRRAVGYGHLDLRPIVAALAEIHYTGYLSAEAFAKPESESAARQTIRAVRYYLGGDA